MLEYFKNVLGKHILNTEYKMHSFNHASLRKAIEQHS